MGGGGGRSRENLAIIAKDFEKTLLFCKKLRGGGVGQALCLFPSCIKHAFLSVFTFAVDQYFTDSTSASRGEDKHLHVELETKDRNFIILLLLALFLFCFPNWAEIEKNG